MRLSAFVHGSGFSIPGLSGLPGFSGLGLSIGSDVAKAVFGGLASIAAAGAVWLVRHVAALVLPVSGVDLTAGWFVLQERSIREVAFFCFAPLLAMATLGAILRQDLRRLARIWVVGLPVGVIGGLLGTTFVAVADGVVDLLCRDMGGRSTAAGIDRVATDLALPGTPVAVQALVAVLVTVGAVLLWLELVLRSTAIYLALFFFPLGMATMIWPATAPVARRFVEVLAALIISKFVVVATLTFGVAALGASHPSVNSALVGTAVLLLGAFAPFMVLRLIPLIEFGAIAHLEGLSRRPFHAAGRAAATARAPARVDAAASGSAGGLSGGPVQASALPVRAADWSLRTGWVDGSSAAGTPPPPASPGIGLDEPVGAGTHRPSPGRPAPAGGGPARPGSGSTGGNRSEAAGSGSSHHGGGDGHRGGPPPASPGIGLNLLDAAPAAPGGSTGGEAPTAAAPTATASDAGTSPPSAGTAANASAAPPPWWLLSDPGERGTPGGAAGGVPGDD